jgi:predicted RND superfamily exporter protein
LRVGVSVGDVSREVVPWLIRRRRLVLCGAAALSIVATAFAARLYGDLRSGIEELLPESAPSVVAARSLAPRLRGATRLSVVLEGEEPAALRRFADDLAARLRALPASLVDAVDYRADEEQAFARRFGLLYVSTADLTALRDGLVAEKRKANPLFVSLDEDDHPPLNLDQIEARYAALDAGRFPDGYFQSRDGKILVVQVRPPEASTGLQANQKLLRAVEEQVARLHPSKLRVGYSGEVAEIVEEQASLVADLAASTAVVTALVFLVLWLYFRRWPAIAALLLALGSGTALTFGIADLLVGHLNANTAFLGCIVLGNGINVGIIVVARYLEERRAGIPLEESIRLAWALTMPATFVAAFGAGVAYLSLASTDFRGFSQFGGLGAMGMALCWVFAYLLLPPLLYALERRAKPPAPRPRWRVLAWMSGRMQSRPSVFLAAGLAILLGCGVAIASYRGELLEHDMTRLRSRNSLEHGAVYWAQKTDRVFEAYLTPVVLWSDTPQSLDRVVAAVEWRRQALGARDPLREVISLSTAVPKEQQAKLPLLAEIRGLLSDDVLRRLNPRQRQLALRLRPPADLRVMTWKDLPGDLRRALTELDGTMGRVALAFPRKVGGLDLDDVERIKEVLRGAIDDAQVPALAANSLLILSDIDDAIWRDGPKATLLAFALVCLLVVAVVRKARPALTVIGSLLLGLAGLIGVAAAARVRVNFLNFVVLPITLGIGVDYAINVVQRLWGEPGESVGHTLRETGGAVALCSATTVIGYGSLMVADNQALANFGFLAALGEVTCIFAALTVLPAWLIYSGRRATGSENRSIVSTDVSPLPKPRTETSSAAGPDSTSK